MIIVKLKGGLGNQMFQYAAGRALAEKNNTSLSLDAKGYLDPRVFAGDTPRSYKLQHFTIKANVLSPQEAKKYDTIIYKITKKIKRLFHKQDTYAFDENFFTTKDNSYIEGFWQSEKYFKNIEEKIRQEFTLKEQLSPAANNALTNIQRNSNPVSIHIRRGDYVKDAKTNAFHGACSLDYYENAIQYIKERTQSPTFFIFSDDIEWVKENLNVEQATFVSHPDIKDYEEMILMSCCKNHIIANSSFSWWSAWLNPNPNKIVIAPKKWVNDPKAQTDNVVPTTWITM